MYFSTVPIPRNVDVEQLTALSQFRDDLATRGLLGEFASDDDLKAEVRSAIEHDLTGLNPLELVRPAVKSGALLLADYDSEREAYMDSKWQAQAPDPSREVGRQEPGDGNRDCQGA